jgi:hypothetical protein
VTVVRKGDWKLHLYHEEWQLDGGREKIATNNAVELYNLATDPGETTNLVLSQRWIDRRNRKRQPQIRPWSTMASRSVSAQGSLPA